MERTLNSERSALFVRLLRETRLALGVTQVQLAERLQIHQTEVSRVERGLTRVDVLELGDWLEALGVPLVEFVLELGERLKAMKLRNRQARPGQRAHRT